MNKQAYPADQPKLHIASSQTADQLRIAQLEQAVRSAAEQVAYCLRGNKGYHSTMLQLAETLAV